MHRNSCNSIHKSMNSVGSDKLSSFVYKTLRSNSTVTNFLRVQSIQFDSMTQSQLNTIYATLQPFLYQKNKVHQCIERLDKIIEITKTKKEHLIEKMNLIDQNERKNITEVIMKLKTVESFNTSSNLRDLKKHRRSNSANTKTSLKSESIKETPIRTNSSSKNIRHRSNSLESFNKSGKEALTNKSLSGSEIKKKVIGQGDNSNRKNKRSSSKAISINSKMETGDENFSSYNGKNISSIRKVKTRNMASRSLSVQMSAKSRLSSHDYVVENDKEKMQFTLENGPNIRKTFVDRFDFIAKDPSNIKKRSSKTLEVKSKDENCDALGDNTELLHKVLMKFDTVKQFIDKHKKNRKDVAKASCLTDIEDAIASSPKTSHPIHMSTIDVANKCLNKDSELNHRHIKEKDIFEWVMRNLEQQRIEKASNKCKSPQPTLDGSKSVQVIDRKLRDESDYGETQSGGCNASITVHKTVSLNDKPCKIPASTSSNIHNCNPTNHSSGRNDYEVENPTMFYCGDFIENNAI